MREGHKQTIEGEIPDSWEVVNLEEVVEINPPKPQGIAEDAQVSFVGMADVSEDAKLINHQTRKYKEVAKGFAAFMDGDIIVAKITPYFENGKGALVEDLTNGIGFGSTEFHVLRAKAKAFNKFIYYHTTNSSFRELGKANMTGSTGQKRIPRDFIAKYTIPLPPITEQQKISEILSVVDQKMKIINEQKQCHLKLRKGLVQALLTGKIRVKI